LFREFCLQLDNKAFQFDTYDKVRKSWWFN